jgi:hypothetical protein
MKITDYAGLYAAVMLSGLTSVPTTLAQAPASAAPQTTILYLTRHAEDVPELVEWDPSFSVSFNDCNADESCCVEALNPLGIVRAAALADWLEKAGITHSLTHVVASHKLRTRQTVARIAYYAGLGGDLNGDGIPDGTDVDQAPGDGVINVPATPAECDLGWTSSSSVTQPQIDFIKTLPVGSRAVICTHSPVMYPLMQAFGIDTSDPTRFPKDTRNRVVGFNNLWVVELKPVSSGGAISYRGRLLSHVRLDIELSVSLVNRDYGLKVGKGAKSDE